MKIIDISERIVKSLATARIHVGEARKEVANAGPCGIPTNQYNAIESAIKALDSALFAFSTPFKA